MIESVRMERSTFARRRTSSRPAPRRSPQAVGLARPSTTSTASAWTMRPAHEQALIGYALDGASGDPGLRILGPPTPSTAGARSPSCWTGCTRTTSARCWTSRASRSGPGTTAPGRSPHATASRRIDPGVVLPVHHAGRGRRAGRGHQRGAEVLRGERDGTRVVVPGDHPGPLPEPAPQGPAGAVRRRGAPRQPDLRRRGHPAGDARTRRRPVVEDVSYDALGCSISQACASVMTDLVIGKTGRRGVGAQRGVPGADAVQGRRRAPTRTCWKTRSRSRASPSIRPGSSARCWAGWPGRTRPRRRWPGAAPITNQAPGRPRTRREQT